MEAKVDTDLKGRLVVFVGAGCRGKRFIYQLARQQGLKTAVVDSSESWIFGEVDIVNVAVAVDIDIKDSEHQKNEGEVVLEYLRAIRQVEVAMGQSVDAVVTFWEMATPLVAQLTTMLNLPGNSVESVLAARNKCMTRLLMERAGLPSPAFKLVSCINDVHEAMQEVGFPAVIKPVSGAASVGVQRVNNEVELMQAYEDILQKSGAFQMEGGAVVYNEERTNKVEASKMGAVRANHSLGARHGHKPLVPGWCGGKCDIGWPLIEVEAVLGDEDTTSEEDDQLLAPGFWVSHQLLVEEYLEGPEVDCDVVLFHGQCLFAAISDNWPCQEPFFNETGSNVPSLLPDDVQAQLQDLALATLATLGLTHGVFHVEEKWTSRGPRVVEVNARMGGGTVRDLNLWAWGVDLVQEQLKCALGIPPTSLAPHANNRLLRPQQPLQCLAELCFNAPTSGVLQEGDFLKKWRGHPDVKFCEMLVPAGTHCCCVQDGMPTWVCEMVVSRKTVEDAIEFIQHVEATTPIPIL